MDIHQLVWISHELLAFNHLLPVALSKNPDLYYFQKGLKSGLNIHDNSLHFYVSIGIKKIKKLIPEGKSSSCLIQPCDCLSHKEFEKKGGFWKELPASSKGYMLY